MPVLQSQEPHQPRRFMTMEFPRLVLDTYCHLQGRHWPKDIQESLGYEQKRWLHIVLAQRSHKAL